MNADEVRRILKREVDLLGSQRAFARKHKLSAAYINDVLLGRRNPADAICKALGLGRLVSYHVTYHQKHKSP